MSKDILIGKSYGMLGNECSIVDIDKVNMCELDGNKIKIGDRIIINVMSGQSDIKMAIFNKLTEVEVVANNGNLIYKMNGSVIASTHNVYEYLWLSTSHRKLICEVLNSTLNIVGHKVEDSGINGRTTVVLGVVDEVKLEDKERGGYTDRVSYKEFIRLNNMSKKRKVYADSELMYSIPLRVKTAKSREGLVEVEDASGLDKYHTYNFDTRRSSKRSLIVTKGKTVSTELANANGVLPLNYIVSEVINGCVHIVNPSSIKRCFRLV